MGRWGSWGAGCGCCASAPVTQICANLQGCGVSPASATITITDSGNNTVATGTSDGQVTQLQLSNQKGAGYTNGTGFALGFVGGGATTPATGTFDVASGAVSAVHLTSGGHGYQGVPTLDLSAAGTPTTPATITVTASGVCCLAVPGPGNYSVTASGSGWTSSTQSVLVLNAGQTKTTTFSLSPDADHQCCNNMVIPLSLYITDANTTTQVGIGVGVAGRNGYTFGGYSTSQSSCGLVYTLECGTGGFNLIAIWGGDSSCWGPPYTPMTGLQTNNWGPCRPTGAWACAGVFIPWTGGPISGSGSFPAFDDYDHTLPCPVAGSFTFTQ